MSAVRELTLKQALESNLEFRRRGEKTWRFASSCDSFTKIDVLAVDWEVRVQATIDLDVLKRQWDKYVAGAEDVGTSNSSGCFTNMARGLGLMQEDRYYASTG